MEIHIIGKGVDVDNALEAFVRRRVGRTVARKLDRAPTCFGMSR
jgi:hypothetical protein